MPLKGLVKALLCAVSLIAEPALAEPLPKIEDMAASADGPSVARVLETLGTDARDVALPNLDALLQELTRPSQVRGVVQFYRAALLARGNRLQEANDAVVESIRLLPAYSAPLLLASQMQLYSDKPDASVDYLIRASRIDPEIVNVFDDYEMSSLLHRLVERKDRRRTYLLSERLLEVSWANGRSATRSSMAMAVLEQRLAGKDVPGASAMVTKILSPAMFARLLTENQFAPLLPVAEDWAGARLEKQWPIYLEQARAEWEATRDPSAAAAYARALSAAGHDQTLVRVFLPLLQSDIDPEEDALLVFVVSQVADALARLGRWRDVAAVFDRAARVWPAGSSANALNIDANRARLLFYRGDFEESVKQMDSALQEADRWQGQVNAGALTMMHLYRACALEQLGRAEDATISAAIVAAQKNVNPSALVTLLLCRNDLEAARQVLLNALEIASLQPDVLAFMQPDDGRSIESDFAKTMRARTARLKLDRQLLAAARRDGRILEYPINSTAPQEAAE